MQLFSKKAFDFRGQAAIFKDLRALVLCGLFMALYVAISTFNIRITPTLEIRFGPIILAISGFYGGPIMGAVVGAAGDILSYLAGASASGPLFPGFTFSYALMGFLCGMVLYGQKITPLRGFLASMVEFLISVFITTYWLVLMYSNGHNYPERLITRLPKCVSLLIVDTVLIFVIVKAFQEAVTRAHLMPDTGRRIA